MDFISLVLLINRRLGQPLFKSLGGTSNVVSGISDDDELGYSALVSPATPIVFPIPPTVFVLSSFLFFTIIPYPTNERPYRPRHVLHSSRPAMTTKPDSTGLAGISPRPADSQRTDRHSEKKQEEVGIPRLEG